MHAFNDGAEPKDRTVWSSAQPKGWFKLPLSTIALTGSYLVRLPEATTGKQKTEAITDVQKPNSGDKWKDTSKVFNDGDRLKDPTELSSATLKSSFRSAPQSFC